MLKQTFFFENSLFCPRYTLLYICARGLLPGEGGGREKAATFAGSGQDSNNYSKQSIYDLITKTKSKISIIT